MTDQRTADQRTIEERVARLKASLAWALRYINDGCGDEDTPRHECEFHSNPEKGACDFHTLYWEAREALRE